LNDRASDNWRSLLAIADLAGGAWRERARRAALLLSAGVTEDSDVRVQLLADMRDIFEEQRAERLASELVVEQLTILDSRPWGEWRRGKPLTATGLARLLKSFGIKSKQLWLNDANVHGYERADFADAWMRYLPPENGHFEPLDPLERSPDKDFRAISQPLDVSNPSGSQNSGNACARRVLAPLAFQSGDAEGDGVDREVIEL
jgi:hypothetical protein